MGLKCMPKERAILDAWPVVTAEDIQQMNDLFPHYIFFRPDKEGVIFRTSCCGRTERLNYLRKTELPWETQLLSSVVHNREYSCPWCSQVVMLKDLRKAGKRKQLERYEFALLLHAREDALYADAVVLNKDYSTEGGLTAKPAYRLSSMYHFAPGDVMQVDYQVYGDGHISHEQKKLDAKVKWVKEPFKKGGFSCFSYEYYAILNRNAVKECPITRYSGYFEYWRKGNTQKHFHDFSSYMTAYCIYPRQIEMLVKAGLREPVRALIYDRKKFADVIDWSEPDIRKAMRLTGPELRDVIAMKPPMEALELRNLARRWFGKKWSIQEAVDFARQWSCEVPGRYVLSFCRRYKLDPDRLVRYLEYHQVIDPDIPWADITEVFQMYRDYIEMAWQLGMCMEHGKVLWPDDLHAAHDQASAQLVARQDAEVAKLSMKKGTVSGAVRKKKYEFELDGLRISFPLTAAAIRYEGKVLSHCVGGYADRHIKGVLTILFLRRVSQPNRPYVTIEMDGNRIVQVHGYRNDLGSQSPKATHKEFFDTWLAWLKAGSRRDKDGKPILPKKRKTEAA